MGSFKSLASQQVGMAATTNGPRGRRATAVRGAAIGVVAFLAGYLVAFLTAASVVRRVARAFRPLAEAGGRFVPGWKAAGWAFLDGHFVGTTYPGGTVDMVAMGSVEFLYLVPPLLLLLAGGVLAWAAGSTTPRDGLNRGMAVAVGYLPMAVIFAVLLRHANVQPSLLRALVVAGLVYPVAFGGIGGALAGVVAEEGAA